MIYFDNAATYAVNNKDIIDCFIKASHDYIANSHSSHRLGYLVNRAIDSASLEVLKTLNLDNSYEVIFNSGATEGVNHAILGYCNSHKNRGNEIISFKNEHASVLETLKVLEKKGFIIHYLNSDSKGEVVYDELERTLNSNTIMVAIMSVNNEVGSVNDLRKIRKLVNNYPKCVLFSDVTQSVGKLSIDYRLLDIFAFSAHKIGGIIGSGILIKKKKISLEKLLNGGAQQNNLRAGTVATALAISTTYALKKAVNNLDQHYKIVKSLFDRLINGLSNNQEIKINSQCVFPYIVNISLKTKKASVVIEALSQKEIYVSSQSACNEKQNTVSYVLTNMGLDNHLAENSIRISFSYQNTIQEVEEFILVLNKILEEIK